MAGLRVLAYDRAEQSPVGWSWMIGAWFYGLWFDVVIPCRSWNDFFQGCAKAVQANGQQIAEVQYWGHGTSGAPVCNRELLNPTPHGHFALLVEFSKWLTKPALIWFRCCSVFFGQPGKDFAEALVTLLGAQVAGHTHVIGWPWHSGLHTARPGIPPAWPASEGAGIDGKPMKSSATAPHTIFCLRTKYPPVW